MEINVSRLHSNSFTFSARDYIGKNGALAVGSG